MTRGHGRLDRLGDYLSTSGVTLSGWILSIAFVLGRLVIGPF